jgi:hypothetical protein
MPAGVSGIFSEAHLSIPVSSTPSDETVEK